MPEPLLYTQPWTYIVLTTALPSPRLPSLRHHEVAPHGVADSAVIPASATADVQVVN